MGEQPWAVGGMEEQPLAGRRLQAQLWVGNRLQASRKDGGQPQAGRVVEDSHKLAEVIGEHPWAGRGSTVRVGLAADDILGVCGQCDGWSSPSLQQ